MDPTITTGDTEDVSSGGQAPSDDEVLSPLKEKLKQRRLKKEAAAAATAEPAEQ